MGHERHILGFFSENNKQYMVLQSESSMHKGPVISLYRKVESFFPVGYTISDKELEELRSSEQSMRAPTGESSRELDATSKDSGPSLTPGRDSHGFDKTVKEDENAN